MSRRYVVGRASELADGDRLIVEVGGRSVGIFRVGDRLYALRNRCPHAGGELCRGRVLGRLESPRPGRYVHDLSRPLIACPWHGWEFDLATGQSYFDPERTRVRAYRAAVACGAKLAGEVERGEVAPAAPTGELMAAGSVVPGPYRAETVPVSVQDDYVVLTLGSESST